MTRLAAVVVLIALPLSAWAQCAGWQRTAEARMACCAQEDQCPMHAKSKSGSHEMTAQAQADTCCALSERAPSTPSSSSHLVSPVALTSTPAAVVLTDLLQEATQKNPDLVALQRQIEVMRHRPAQERALKPPMAEAQIWQWPINSINPANTNMYMFMVSQEFPGRGKRELRAAVA